VKAGSSPYKTLQSSTTLSPIAKALFPALKIAKLTTTTYKGVPSYAISWSNTSNGTTSHQTSYIPTVGRGLPDFAVGSTSTATQTIAFSRWHESIAIITPKETIAFSKVS